MNKVQQWWAARTPRQKTGVILSGIACLLYLISPVLCLAALVSLVLWQTWRS